MAGENNQKVNNDTKGTKNSNQEVKKSLGQSISETRTELKKVQWPNKNQLQKYTVATIVTVFFFSVAIYIIDSGLGFVISKLVNS